MAKFIIFSFIFLLFTTSIYAQDAASFTEKELTEIKNQLSISNTIYQIALSASDKSQIPLSESSWMKELEESSVQLLRVTYQMPEQEKLVTRVRKMVNWKSLLGQVKTLAPKIKSYSRLNGLGLVFALVATSPSEIVAPIIVTALGRPDLIPLAVAFPTTGVAVGGQIALQRFFVKKELIKSMGSKEIYQAFVETRREHRKILKMASVDDYLHKFSDEGGELEILVVEKENYFTRFKESIGIKKTNVTYSKVMDFCTRRNLLDDDFFIKSISERMDLPNEYKAGLILEHLRKTGDEILIDDLYAWFSDGIVKITLTSEMEDLYKIAKDMSKAETLAELQQKIINLPSDTNAKLLAEVWRNRIVKDLSLVNKDLNHFEFRRLINNFTKLYGELQAQGENVFMDSATKKKWMNYLENVSSEKLTCSDQYLPI